MHCARCTPHAAFVLLSESHRFYLIIPFYMDSLPQTLSAGYLLAGNASQDD